MNISDGDGDFSVQRILIHTARIALCILMSVTMLAGIVQIGLRWEARQQSVNLMAVLTNGTVVNGAISQDWWGDFIITDRQGGERTIPLNGLRMANFQPERSPPIGDPWRAILSMLMSTLFAAVVSWGTLVATKSWVATKPKTPAPVRKALVRKAPETPSPGIKNGANLPVNPGQQEKPEQ